ncbi:MAG: dihydrodipicolinate synthase family protein [Dehalococcoidia bacterium]
MADRSMRGVFPILQTPFDENGEILFEDLRSEVDFAIRSGVHGLGIAFGSEVNKLSDHERDQVLSTVVDQAAGRAKVVMNTGAQSTILTIHYSKAAQVLGANGVMISPPTAGNPPVAEVRRHYLAVAEATSLPIFMQDLAGATLAPSLMADLAKAHENLCYAKVETLPTPHRFAEAAASASKRLSLFGGANGVFFIEELQRGGVGTMQGIAICDVVRRVWDRFQSGDEGSAAEIWDRYQPLVKLYSMSENQSYYVAKEILRKRGVISKACPRLPARKPDDGIYRQIAMLMERLEIS